MWHSSTHPGHVVSATLITCALLGAAGCTGGRNAALVSGGKGTLQRPTPEATATPTPTATPAPTPAPGTMADQTAPRRGAIATITTTDQQVLVELAVDANARGHALEAGMFFRVLTDGGRIFKGLVQVTEVLSPTRCIARQAGLTDRTRALATGDQVLEVADLAALAAPEAVETAARNQQLRLDQLDAADRRLFEAVRANYQQALADTTTRHQADLADLERRHREQLDAAEQAARLTTERREAEARAAEIATRAAMTEAVGRSISEERQASAERLASLTRERDQLRAQVDGLVAQQSAHAARIEALVREMADRQRLHAAQERAEAETREVLQARLDEVEARLAGRPPGSPVVLTADPDHPETVLERLTRVTRERNDERAAREKLAADLLRFTATVTELRAENTALAQRLETLTGANARADEALAGASTARERLAAAERAQGVAELARLEAERRLYDLAARVLRLSDTTPATVALQARLRDNLAAQGVGGTGGVP